MRFNRFAYLVIAVAATPLAAPPSLAQDQMQAAKSSGTIVQGAMASTQHKTLVAAVKAAGLVDTLTSAGPFTVFAPTDAAFAKIPKAKLDALLKDKAALTKVLTYHVVPGSVMAADVKPGMVKTVEGSSFKVSTKGSTVMVDKAQVVKTDIAADNGVIHVIDSVIMPK